MSLSKAVALVNPTAGNGRALVAWRRLLASTPRANELLEIITPDPESSRRELADVLAAGGIDRVIAVGGDGTAHLVINVLLEGGFADHIALGLIPAGTGSDLARGLGLPRRPEAAFQALFSTAPKPMDAVRIETSDGRHRYIANIASAGLSGKILSALAAPTSQQQEKQKKSYLATTVRELLTYRPVPYRLQVEGETVFEGPVFLIAAANGCFFGGGMQVAPRARINDGNIEIVVIPPVPKWQLPLRLPQFLTGRHIHLPMVISRKARHLLLECLEDPPPFDLDGEIFHASALEAQILPHVLRIL